MSLATPTALVLAAVLSTPTALPPPPDVPPEKMKPIPGLSEEANQRLAPLRSRLHSHPPEWEKAERELARDATLSELTSLVVAEDNELMGIALGALEKQLPKLDEHDVKRLVDFVISPGEGEGNRRTVAALVAKNPLGVKQLRAATDGSAPLVCRVMAAGGLTSEESVADEATKHKATELLLEALADPDDETARRAHNTLPKMQPWMGKWLLEHMAKPDAPQRLVSYGNELISNLPKDVLREERKAMVVSSLDAPTVNARMSAVSGLVALGKKESDLPLYQKAAHDADPNVRGMVYSSLANEPQAWSAKLFLDGLDDGSEENRSTCAHALGQLKYKPAVPALVELMRKGVDPADDGKSPVHEMKGDQQAAGAALATIAGLKDVDFATTEECFPIGPDNGAHAIKIVRRPEVYRESAKKVLAWWDSTGHKLYPASAHAHEKP
jgi:hypothetical protein